MRQRRNKYGAVRTVSRVTGRTYASRAEARRADELALLERAGEISGLEEQPLFILSTVPRVTYRADFRYTTRDGQLVIEDVKGELTRECRVKLAWLRERGIKVRLVGNTFRRAF